MASVTLKGVRKNFGKTEVIKGVDLDVEDGELMNFLRGKISSVGAGAVDIQLATGGALSASGAYGKAAVGDAVSVGIRPEHLTAVNGGALSGAVEVVERLGPETLVNVTMSDKGSITASLPGDSPVKVGETISFAPSLQHVHLFDAAGQAMVKA